MKIFANFCIGKINGEIVARASSPAGEIEMPDQCDEVLTFDNENDFNAMAFPQTGGLTFSKDLVYDKAAGIAVSVSSPKGQEIIAANDAAKDMKATETIGG